MKVRSGFVSNSSSSSFILYGREMETEEVIDLLVKNAEDKFIEAANATDVDGARAFFENQWGDELSSVFADVYPGIEIDDYPSEDGSYCVGLTADPEYLSKDQVLNGVFSKEQVQKVDEFFDEINMKTGVDGGIRYS